ncbi:hypothetical protein AKJ58_00275 [candidate division MSBL1 archaeon SCGC-AAA385D11]|uniref:Uncharacterized protein n=1 Tax=candidate division MSBL1 archaeon SCGC-AAA385D11 TaxID=1698286 RepID=A0A133VPH0_9EURY|nr:hypothetical protein AKJ58_00275 [candidate division MSBL1 archaeon SCGC-AAA385D11]
MIGITGRVAEIFEEANCPYVVTGGVAVVYYGVLRLTHDVDFLIQKGLSESRINKLLNLLHAEGFSFDEKEVHQRLRQGGMVRMTGAEGFVKGFVVDLIARPRMDPILEHSRKVEEGKIHMISPEDLIVQKLLIIKETSPPKLRPHDKEDVVALLIAREELNLEMDYLHERAKEERVDNLLEKFLKKIEELAE